MISSLNEILNIFFYVETPILFLNMIVFQYAEQLPREYSVLKFVSLGECLLEGQQNGKISYNSLHLAKDYINKVSVRGIRDTAAIAKK